MQITASFYPRLSFVLLQIEQTKKKHGFLAEKDLGNSEHYNIKIVLDHHCVCLPCMISVVLFRMLVRMIFIFSGQMVIFLIIRVMVFVLVMVASMMTRFLVP